MGFQEFRDEYLKTTVPENKMNMINTIGNYIDKDNLSFLLRNIKTNQTVKYEQQLLNLLLKVYQKLAVRY
jgi:uncharacterized protein YcbK (DUF882 family)